MRINVISHNAHHAALGVLELKSLVQDVNAFDYGSGKKEELLIAVRSQFFETLVQKQRTTPIVIHASDTFTFKDSIGLEKQTEFYKRNPRAMALSAAIAVASTGLGLVFAGWVGAVIGLVISLLAIPLLPPTVTKTRQIERTSSR